MMSLALAKSALLWPLELAINQVLQLDPASRARLAPLAGSSLAVTLQRPAFTVFVIVHADRLQLSPHNEGPITTTVTGSPQALASLLLQRHSLTSLQGTGVEMRGSTAFAQALQQLLLGLDIDWEFQLSRLLGDIPTRIVADSVRATSDYVQRTASRVRNDIGDFLLEEGRLLPTAGEMERFADDLQALTLRIDRAAARLALLDT
jgi:ubiquinone biosynthesis protein UbiJ